MARHSGGTMTMDMQHVTTDAEIADTIRGAAARGETLRIVGAGTWLTAGHPVQATRAVSVAHDTGVVAYHPGDLVITVRAGTTLAELDDALRPHRQYVPLDPEGGRQGTVGATVATASYGPLAELYGTPRDQVLGLTVVTGMGAIVQPGGHVVKNVAGFDLTRLMIGAWGTLGLITQVTLRVRVRRQYDTTRSFEHMRRPMPGPYGYREPMLVVPSLARAIKRTFDPHHILNPGIMGEQTVSDAMEATNAAHAARGAGTT